MMAFFIKKTNAGTMITVSHAAAGLNEDIYWLLKNSLRNILATGLLYAVGWNAQMLHNAVGSEKDPSLSVVPLVLVVEMTRAVLTKLVRS